jgi:hypothetical protein
VSAATAGRLALGLLTLARPASVPTLVRSPDRDDPWTLLAARVLGGRLVLHAVADLTFGRRTRWPGIVVELTHAASMLPVALRSQRHRRSATVSAVCATALACSDLLSMQESR